MIIELSSLSFWDLVMKLQFSSQNLSLYFREHFFQHLSPEISIPHLLNICPHFSLTGCGLDGLGSILVGRRKFSLLHSVQTDSGAHLSPYTISAGDSVLRSKATWTWVDHSPPSNKEFRALPPLSHTPSWRGVLLMKHKGKLYHLP
jgi:hypothetical protein